MSESGIAEKPAYTPCKSAQVGWVRPKEANKCKYGELFAFVDHFVLRAECRITPGVCSLMRRKIHISNRYSVEL